MNSIDHILASVKRLPPFPQVARRAAEMLNDPHANSRDLVKIIEYDQGITANILKLCNSAYFGIKVPVSSLHQAVSFLGHRNLMSVIFASCSVKYYRSYVPGYDLEKGELWRHSVACAILSQILAQKSGQKDHQVLFTAGLLHDIGKLVLSVFVKDRFEEIIDLVRSQRCSFLDAEQRVLGLDHAQLGGRIAEEWNFPPAMSRAISLHHNPEMMGGRDSLAATIHLADLGCLLLGIGVGADGLAYRAYQEVMNRFGFRERDLESALSELVVELTKAEELVLAV
jgi:putative nucleotidyltransferase with HDIG domain